MACVVGTRLVGTGDPQLKNPNFSRTTTRSALSSLGRSCQDEDRVRPPEGLMGAGSPVSSGLGVGTCCAALTGDPGRHLVEGTVGGPVKEAAYKRVLG